MATRYTHVLALALVAAAPTCPMKPVNAAATSATTANMMLHNTTKAGTPRSFMADVFRIGVIPHITDDKSGTQRELIPFTLCKQ